MSLSLTEIHRITLTEKVLPFNKVLKVMFHTMRYNVLPEIFCCALQETPFELRFSLRIFLHKLELSYAILVFNKILNSIYFTNTYM